ncbi:MAG: tyrosine-type recombinase/integrase [Shimia sp.]|uniref:site-specific integrase n=1 Tax=Shimia sp. TaxID=1954381 RepID=UPI001B13E022|nr:site-specific integrase [Shimia sp.]MBO6899510.1 tyrosine-type recombinase/integrase [Shimia sp.]
MLDKPQTIQSLADVHAQLIAHHSADEKRLKAHLSAISRTATYLNRAEADIPTDVPQLRRLLIDLHPAQCGVTPQSLRTVKSALAAALRAAGVLHDHTGQTDLTADWQAFVDQIKNDHQLYGIIRFARYCSSEGFAPKDVTSATVAGFRAFLDAHLLTGDPDKQIRYLTNNWNHLNKNYGLGMPFLSLANPDRFRTRPLSDYPDSLQKDLQTYLERVSCPILFDDDAPDAPLKPTSLRNIEAHIRQLLHALVEAGAAPTAFTCLRDVVTPANVKRGLNGIMTRSGKNDVPSSLSNISGTCLAIARHYLKLEDNDLASLKTIRKRVAPKTTGMSAKNSERLAQFNDPHNVVLLLSLPKALMDRAERAPASRKSAIAAMHATSIGILLCCPMRIKNLASLDIDKHLITHGTGAHAQYTIRIEADEVKNAEAIEFKVNKAVSKMLHRYIIQFRPLLSTHRGTALFPRASDGKARTPDNFGKAMTECIKRETGLAMHPHLFRHLAAKLFLEVKPGQFEVVRQMLKHKTLQTTTDFYAETNNSYAHEHYDDVVLSKLGMKDA